MKFGPHSFKTNKCPKSLNPVWNSETFHIEADDDELQDEPLQIRYAISNVNLLLYFILFSFTLHHARPLGTLSAEGQKSGDLLKGESSGSVQK